MNKDRNIGVHSILSQDNGHKIVTKLAFYLDSIGLLIYEHGCSVIVGDITSLLSTGDITSLGEDLDWCIYNI